LLQRRTNLSQMIDGLRIRDPAFAGLAAQIDTTLTHTLQSTIDRNLQRAIQTVLDDTLKAKPQAVGASLRGAVVLMDGLSGQIAGAASFPHRPEHLLARDRSDPNRVRWLEQNQAFEALPVGSTAKVPFAGAITTAQPGLLGLIVPQTYPGAYSSYEFLRSGRVVRGPDSIDGDPRTNVDFNTALVQSDNFYAVSLIRRAWLANRAAPQEAAWLHNIRLLTCGAPASVALPDSACPVFPWGDEDEPRRGRAHSGVRFAFDAAKVEAAPHNELFYGPLGNGSFNWSLVQLTQAYARFMSGRAVAMTLSAGERASPPLAELLRGTGYDQSWDAVMRGMRGVIQSGTAREIKDLEGILGGGVYLYGKTGTPTVGYRADADGKLFVLAAVRTTDGRPPEPADAAPRPSSVTKASRGRICAMRFLAINLEVDTSAVPVARQLVEKNPAVRRWMTAPCPASTAGGK
jgi:cell division protein FtsI/penicillin-binding protein 2